MPENILYIEDLGLDFEEKNGEKTVLNHVNLVQKRGEWIALIGPNGAGKTTLGLVIKGLLQPTRGRLKMFSECIEEDVTMRKRQVGLLFSNPRDQICALTVQGDIAFGLTHMDLSREEIKQRIDEALNTLGIHDLANELTHRLSPGEQQKVALAGLMAMRPDYMILDEPATFLNPKENDELRRLLQGFHQLGMSILYISTAWKEIAMADRVVVLQDGMISWTGSPGHLLQKEDILKKAGQCVPEIYHLAGRLRKNGYQLPDFIHDVDHMVRILCDLFNGRKV